MTRRWFNLEIGIGLDLKRRAFRTSFFVGGILCLASVHWPRSND